MDLPHHRLVSNPSLVGRLQSGPNQTNPSREDTRWGYARTPAGAVPANRRITLGGSPLEALRARPGDHHFVHALGHGVELAADQEDLDAERRSATDDRHTSDDVVGIHREFFSVGPDMKHQ